MMVTADSPVPQDVVDVIAESDGFEAGRTVSLWPGSPFDGVAPTADGLLNELQLGRPRKPLDAGLLAKRCSAVGDLDDRGQLHRQTAARVAARRTGPMRRQPASEVGRPTAVEAVVRAPQQVDVRRPVPFGAVPDAPAVAPARPELNRRA